MLWQISGERSSFLKVRKFTRQNFRVDRVVFIVFTDTNLSKISSHGLKKVLTLHLSLKKKVRTFGEPSEMGLWCPSIRLGSKTSGSASHLERKRLTLCMREKATVALSSLLVRHKSPELCAWIQWSS